MSGKIDQLIENLTTDLKKIQIIRLGFKEMFKIIFVGFACVFSAVILSGLRIDFREVVMTKQFIIQTLILLILCFISIITAFSLSVPSQNMRPIYRRPVFYIVIYILSLASMFLTSADPFLYLGHGFTCFTEIISISIFPAAVLFYFIRRAATLRRDLLGTIVLLSGVTFGLLGVQLTCADETPLHLLFWHLIPSMFFIWMGIFFGRKIFIKI